MRKIFSLLAAFTGLFGANAKAVSTQSANTPTSHEIRAARRKGVTRMIDMQHPGDFLPSGNPLKHKWGLLNQRQRRKWMRQVPQMLNSKKYKK